MLAQVGGNICNPTAGRPSLRTAWANTIKLTQTTTAKQFWRTTKSSVKSAHSPVSKELASEMWGSQDHRQQQDHSLPSRNFVYFVARSISIFKKEKTHWKWSISLQFNFLSSTKKKGGITQNTPQILSIPITQKSKRKKKLSLQQVKAERSWYQPAAVGTACLPRPLEPGPACWGGTAVRLGDHRSLLGMDCSAVAGNGGEYPSHTAEASSSPLGPLDCPVRK